MKKFCLILLLLFFVSSFIFANTQKYYRVSSREWREVNALCHVAGVTGPTSSGPVTGEALLSALKRAEKKLGKDNLYCVKVRERLEKDNLTFFDGVGLFDFIAEFNPELYIDANPSVNRTVEYDGIIYPYKADEDWLLRDYNKRKDMFNIKIEAGLRDILYGSVERNFTRTKDDNGFF